MHTWQRFTAIATGVAALHGAALWAAHSYRARADAADKPAALTTRTVQTPVDVAPAAGNLPLDTPVQPVSPVSPVSPVLPKSAVAPVTKNVTAQSAALPSANLPAPAPAPAPAAAPAESPSANTSLQLAPAGKAATFDNSDVTSIVPQPAATATASGAAGATSNAPQKAAGVAAVEVNLVRPAYTQLTQKLDQTGRVQIAFEVDTDGHTVNAQVAQSSGFSTLDAAALNAARKTRYKPAMCGDKKVPSKYTRNYAFGVDALPDPPQPFIDCTRP